MTDLILAEIHRAIEKLGGSTKPTTTGETYHECVRLGAGSDLLSIIGSWQDTLDDEHVLDLLRDWNAGRPLFQTVFASTGSDDDRHH